MVLLDQAAKDGNLECIKTLRYQGIDVHTRDDLALRIAADSGHFEVVKYLIEHGANIHASNDQALRASAANGYFEVVKYLVNNGANLDVYGDLSFSTVRGCGHTGIAQYLTDMAAKRSEKPIIATDSPVEIRVRAFLKDAREGDTMNILVKNGRAVITIECDI
jgi:ankyrin repeat protein